MTWGNPSFGYKENKGDWRTIAEEYKGKSQDDQISWKYIGFRNSATRR
jgi:hypothetical protein